jgi:ribonuclease-3
MDAALSDLENALGYRFARLELLERALTHRSLTKQQASAQMLENGSNEAAAAGDNERLEFKAHPEWHEGELTRVRAKLVSRQHMAEVAQAIGLGRHLRLSRSEDRGGLRNKSTVLSNGMEAVMAAMFLDGGLEPVRAFAGRWVMGEAAEQLAEELRSGAALGNYKSALQEHLQAARAGSPVYKIRSESGPDHRKRFLVEVLLKTDEGGPGKPLARGKGSTKKHAEQDAAKRALERLAANSAAPEPEANQEANQKEQAAE